MTVAGGQAGRRWSLSVTRPSEALVIVACFLLISIVALASNGLYVDDYLQDLRLPTAALYGTNPYGGLTGPLGPVYYWAYLPFAADGHFVIKDILHTNLLVGWLSGLAGFFLLRGLAGRWTVLAVCLLTFVAAASPREIGDLTVISFLAPYNRWGWALLVPIAFYALTPRNDIIKEAWWRIAMVGAGLFALVFLKVTYGAAACLILGASVVIGTLRIRAVFATGIVALALSGLYELLTHGTMAYIEGIARSLHADREVQSRIAERWWRRNLLIVEGLRYGATYVLLTWLLNPLLSLSPKAWWVWVCTNFRGLAAGAIAVGAALLVMLQNHPRHESPLLSASLFLAAVWAGRDRSDGSTLRKASRPLAFAAIAVFGLSTLALDLASIARHAYVTNFSSGSVAALAGTPWQNLRITPPKGASQPIKTSELITAADALQSTTVNFFVYHEAARVAEGLTFLRQNGKPTDIAFSYYHVDEFPALLGRPSPAKTLQWWDYGRTYSPETVIAPAAVLSDDTWFLQPKHIRQYETNPLGVTIDRSWSLYHGYVETNFELVGEGKYWRYWRRKSAAVAPSAKTLP